MKTTLPREGYLVALDTLGGCQGMGHEECRPINEGKGLVEAENLQHMESRRKRPRRGGLGWNGVHKMMILVVMLLTTISSADAWRRWTLRNGTKDSTHPAARRGHSLLMYDNKVVLFGGKGNDINRLHTPKTYELIEVDGVLEFKSYDKKKVEKGTEETVQLVENDEFIEECIPLIDSDPEAAMARPDCDFNGTKTDKDDVDNYVPSSDYYNDLWWYDLDCERYSDEPCANQTWEVVDPGAARGGCLLYDGVNVCTHPTERYNHQAQVINNQYMLVWGGFSKFCEDYCDDAWVFLFPGEDDSLANITAGERWVQLEPLTTPGKRWKASSTLVNNFIIFFFGGHRLWHGFSDDNSRDNRWSSYSDLPKGGYLSDMWKLNMSNCVPDTTYNLTEQLDFLSNCTVAWEEVTPVKECVARALYDNGQLRPGYTWEERNQMTCYEIWPSARSGHGLVYKDNFLYMFGGYKTYFPFPTTTSRGAGEGVLEADSSVTEYRPSPSYEFYLNDLWQYDISSGKWVQIETSTDDSKPWPDPRTEMSFVLTDDLIVMTGGYRANYFFDELWYLNTTSSRWLKKTKFVHPFYPVNCTANTTVQACPTRGRLTDGLYGRASAPVYVNVTRRQAPGWDGCRDRDDERTDLTWELQYERPSQRSNHAVTYSSKYKLMLLYGGHTYLEEQLEQLEITYNVTATADLWEYKLHQCISNCSNHGTCHYGYCTCDSGYYGIDCSNTSCPGDFCYYDETTNEQICKHCCHAPYTHYDGEGYLFNVGKLSCSLERPGHSEGICDGYGSCLCAPPFVGLDCSMRDCPNNCSDNGWCSYEYPVSRCMCNAGYTGSDCSNIECLNNCSYPNGECDLTTGTCTCTMWPNPYNRSRNWRRYQGLDCSFLIPFASASSPLPPILLGLGTILFILFF
mmetsp:Transcript_2781/g.6512  ORF Transcript_2781/g.6512 Transcript_2781/m.6512 type:complete len:909 (+) Transcript_2781:58-2784(+)